MNEVLLIFFSPDFIMTHLFILILYLLKKKAIASSQSVAMFKLCLYDQTDIFFLTNVCI